MIVRVASDTPTTVRGCSIGHDVRGNETHQRTLKADTIADVVILSSGPVWIHEVQHDRSMGDDAMNGEGRRTSARGKTKQIVPTQTTPILII